MERTCLAGASALRLEEGAGPLAPDMDLAWIARHYAAQLAAGAPFAHADAGGRHAMDRIGLLHRTLVGVNGENLYGSNLFDAARPEQAGRLALDNLMQSPGHRENLLDARWTHGGFGAATGVEGVVLVQLFAERAALLAAPMPVTLVSGRPLPADCLRAASGGFDGIALVPTGRQPVAADFTPPPGVVAPAAGPYRCFFARAYERTAQTARYIIHPGPMLSVVSG